MHEQLALWHNAHAVGIEDENIDPTASTYEHIDFWHRYLTSGDLVFIFRFINIPVARWR